MAAESLFARGAWFCPWRRRPEEAGRRGRKSGVAGKSLQRTAGKSFKKMKRTELVTRRLNFTIAHWLFPTLFRKFAKIFSVNQRNNDEHTDIAVCGL
jgi:hypothetical protein